MSQLDFMKHLLDTGDYSDLTLRYKQIDYKVHKSVVCTQSAFFANAVKEGRFMEGKAGVIKLDEEVAKSPATIKSLLQYLYLDTYAPRSAPQALLPEMYLYQLADFVQVEDLKDIIVSRCEKILNTLKATDKADIELIAAAIRHVYKSIPPPNTALRQIFVRWARERVQYLLSEPSHFEQLLGDAPEFSKDLILAVAQLPARKVRMQCSWCSTSVNVSEEDVSKAQYCVDGCRASKMVRVPTKPALVSHICDCGTSFDAVPTSKPSIVYRCPCCRGGVKQSI